MNGVLVEYIEKFEDGTIYIEFDEDRYINDCMQNAIKSIVTKEQFEIIKYEV